MGLRITLWWAPVGLVWAREEDHTTPSKYGARCRATFPRIVLDKDVGGEVQGPGEGQEDKQIEQGQFLTERRTLANATWIERIETKQISGWYLL